MPWSPIKYFPKIIQNLKNMGYTRQCTMHMLYTEVMRETGIMKDMTLKQTVEAMERLGYIRLLGSGIVEICPDREIKEATAEVEAEKEADNVLKKVIPAAPSPSAAQDKIQPLQEEP